MKRPTRDQARELVDKLEELSLGADEASRRAKDEWDHPGPDVVRHAHAGESREAERLVERAVNYRHAAELARNLLGVR